jgi:hypothetical protein
LRDSFLGEPDCQTTQYSDPTPSRIRSPPARASWARLLKRVFDLDVEHCPISGRALKIIASPQHRRRAAIKDRRSSTRFSAISGCQPVHHRVPLRVESIYSRKSDKPKNRLPNASHKESLAPLPPALRPSRPVEEWSFSSKRKGIHNSAGAAL